MKTAAYILWTLAALSATSIFLVAAFDISWWTPIADRDIVRPMLLAMLHLAALAGGLGFGAICYEESRG